MAQPAIESTIGANTHIKGDIQEMGASHRRDRRGHDRGDRKFVITESAKVRQKSKPTNVSVGAIQGNISANRVEMMDTGACGGDDGRLLINEGAYLRSDPICRRICNPQSLKRKTTRAPSLRLGRHRSMLSLDFKSDKVIFGCRRACRTGTL